MGDFRALCDRCRPMVAHIDAVSHRPRCDSARCLLRAIYGHWQTLQAGQSRWIEGKLRIALRIVAGLAGITVLWTYLIRPEGILWASVPLAGLIRWFGVGAGAIPNRGAYIVDHAPGRNFAASLHLRTESRRLVASGPYRWVRNPM
jgi:protein-S-isoprenylcysteine O-methyltransferase Ste14